VTRSQGASAKLRSPMARERGINGRKIRSGLSMTPLATGGGQGNGNASTSPPTTPSGLSPLLSGGRGLTRVVSDPELRQKETRQAPTGPDVESAPLTVGDETQAQSPYESKRSSWMGLSTASLTSQLPRFSFGHSRMAHSGTATPASGSEGVPDYSGIEKETLDLGLDSDKIQALRKSEKKERRKVKGRRKKAEIFVSLPLPAVTYNEYL
jgi:hypothetical protein